MFRILNPVRRLMNVRIFHVSLWVWLVTIGGALLARTIISAFLMYAAAIGIVGSGIILMVGGRHARRWTGRLFAYSVGLELLAVLLAG